MTTTGNPLATDGVPTTHDRSIDGGLVRALLLLLTLALTATACGGATGVDVADGGTGDSQAGPWGDWVLTTAAPAIEVPEPGRITLNVFDDDGRPAVGGTAACNGYGGRVTLDDGWRLDELSWTEMGCEPGLMQAEQEYLTALQRIDAWARPDASTLVLTGPGTELRFATVEPVQPAAFADTVWEVDGFVSGTGDTAGVSSTMGGAPPVTVVFSSDGGVLLDTGCSTWTGEWTTSGDLVQLPSLGVLADDREPCTEEVLAVATPQEQAVVGVLESSGFTAVVEGQRLTLTAGDRGLTLRATAD